MISIRLERLTIHTFWLFLHKTAIIHHQLSGSFEGTFETVFSLLHNSIFDIRPRLDLWCATTIWQNSSSSKLVQICLALCHTTIWMHLLLHCDMSNGMIVLFIWASNSVWCFCRGTENRLWPGLRIPPFESHALFCVIPGDSLRLRWYLHLLSSDTYSFIHAFHTEVS